MSLVETRYEHIVLGSDNVPYIEGTRIKVIEIILDKIAYGWSPEEILFQHPALSLGEIYSALAYYSDYQEELNKQIEDQLNTVDKLREQTKSSPLLEKLRSQKIF